MNFARTTGEKIFDAANYVFLALLGLLFFLPFWIVATNSFLTSQEFYSRAIVLWPQRPSIAAYQFLFQTDWIYTGYRVTLVTIVVGTAWHTFLPLTAAYALYDKDLPGRRWLHYYLVFPMFFGGGIVPSFILINNILGLRNNYVGIAIAGSMTVFHYLIFRNHFMGIPVELRESAYLDGAREARILWSIILPLSLPTIATLVLFQVVGRWNAWQWGLFYIDDQKMWPLGMVLRQLIVNENLTQQQGEAAQLMQMFERDFGIENYFYPAVRNAAIMVTSIPIIVLYPFFQKYFVKGVLIGSVKG